MLGIEGDRELLTSIDGDFANDPHWQPGQGQWLPPPQTSTTETWSEVSPGRPIDAFTHVSTHARARHS